jgi:hypothetical protein
MVTVARGVVEADVHALADDLDAAAAGDPPLHPGGVSAGAGGPAGRAPRSRAWSVGGSANGMVRPSGTLVATRAPHQTTSRHDTGYTSGGRSATTSTKPFSSSGCAIGCYRRLKGLIELGRIP